MKNEILIQDNRITSARYELSVIQKRVLYRIIKVIREKYVDSDVGNKDLFDNLLVKIPKDELIKDVQSENKKKVKESLVSLRKLSFEINDEERDFWMEVGFINFSRWNYGEVEVEISKEILPYYVELTKSFTAYSLTVAMSLKSQWSQRMYELCNQWKNAGGFNISVQELREMFALEDKYSRYGSLKKFVLETARKELKELYQKDQCDVYFEYSEIKNGSTRRTITDLRFKIISKKTEKEDRMAKRRLVAGALQTLFKGDEKTKNYKFRNDTLTKCDLEPPLMDLIHKKIVFCNERNFPAEEFAKYIRFIINEEILKH